MSELDKLTIEDLSGDQLLLAECIGMDAYKKLVNEYGGMNVYIVKADSLLMNDRNSRIQKDFNGRNYKYLAAKYNLTERTIRDICSPELNRLRNEPIAEQLGFDDIFKK